MPRAVPPPPAFSRRAFVLFLLLAPACFLVVIGIVAALQYRQFRLLVSPRPAVEALAMTASDSARHDALTAALSAFAAGTGPDTVVLSPSDLTLLASASPMASLQGIRIRILGGDSLLASESSRRVEALQGHLAGLFKRFSPVKDGWLNARIEGTPDWRDGILSLTPDRGFLNGVKVPRTALEKHGGLSPRDFLAPEQLPAYKDFLTALDTVTYEDGKILVIRKPD
jgi:hypothetical protein